MNNLSNFGRFVKATKMATFWKDGDSVSYHWNYWNPLTIMVIPFMVLLIIFLGGITELVDNHYNYGFGYSKYWKERLDSREFL